MADPHDEAAFDAAAANTPIEESYPEQFETYTVAEITRRSTWMPPTKIEIVPVCQFKNVNALISLGLAMPPGSSKREGAQSLLREIRDGKSFEELRLLDETIPGMFASFAQERVPPHATPYR